MDKLIKAITLWNKRKDDKIVLEKDVIIILEKNIKFYVDGEKIVFEGFDVVNEKVRNSNITIYKTFGIIYKELSGKKKVIMNDNIIIKEEGKEITVKNEKKDEKEDIIEKFGKMYDKINVKKIGINEWRIYFEEKKIDVIYRYDGRKAPEIEVKTKLKYDMNYKISNMMILKEWKDDIPIEFVLEKLRLFINNCAVLKEMVYKTKFENFMKIIDEINEYFIKEKYISINIIEYNEKKEEVKDEKDTYWKKGTGYGYGSVSSVEGKYNIDVISLIKNNFNIFLMSKIKFILDEIVKFEKEEQNEMISIIRNTTNIIDMIRERIIESSLIDLDNDKEKYFMYFRFLEIIGFEDEIKKKIIELQKLILLEEHITKKTVNEFYEYILRFKFEVKDDKLENEVKDNESYVDKMKEYKCRILEIKYSAYKYKTELSDSFSSRIAKEISVLHDVIQIHQDSSVYVMINENNIRELYFMITASDKTPYDSGCFIFHMNLPTNYPKVPPKVILENTGGCRFNPNLYTCGKVCLSILGTWNGDSSENWIPDKSTISQVIISIQGLIFIENPYFNEPGFERYINTPGGKKKSEDYNQNIRLFTMKHSMIDLLEKKHPLFDEVIRKHFKIKKEYILKICKEWVDMSVEKKEYNIVYEKLVKLLNKL